MRITLRIHDQLYRKAKAAAREGVTITRYIENALQLKLKQKLSRAAKRRSHYRLPRPPVASHSHRKN
jgi:hypothetical protein